MNIGWMVKGTMAAVAVLAVASAALADFTQPAPLAWRWSPQSSGIPDGSPVVTDTAVYVGNGDRVYGIDRDSGNTLWRFPTSEPLNSLVAAPIGFAEHKVIVALEDFNVVAIDALSGKQAWRVNLEQKVVTPPVSIGGVVVMGVAPGELVALKAADGSRVWPKNFKASEPILPFIQAQGNSVFFMSGRTINCLDVTSGAVKWRKNFTQFGGSFNVAGDYVFTNSGSFITVLRAADGVKVWDRQVPEDLACAPGANNQWVVGVTRAGYLYAFDILGRPVFKRGVKLGATTRHAPVMVGPMATVTTQVGTIVMVDVRSGEIKWNTTIHPTSTARPRAEGGLTARGTQQAADDQRSRFVQAAGAPVISGNSLFLLARDGTLLSYDRDNGVDKWAPSADMVFPNPGDTVSGKAPMTLVFHVDDLGVGVNQDSISVTINGKPYAFKVDAEGYVNVEISSDKRNPPIADGRAKIIVHVIDWLGNVTDREYTLTIDNLLPALGGPRRQAPAPANPGIGVGGGGGGESNDGG